MIEREGPNYVIKVVQGAEDLDPENDKVNVLVSFDDGAFYSAVFFTPICIDVHLEEFQRTGEYRGGLYVTTAGMVIVRTMTLEAIEATVAALIANKQFDYAFLRDDSNDYMDPWDLEEESGRPGGEEQAP